MNQHPLISIVTVCFNAQKLIAPTLRSAVCQTFKNFELVIIDGGSTDNTLKEIEPFKPYIGTLISEPDKGIYDAMNKGIKAAKGDWIYFLNAGDSFYNNSVIEKIFSHYNTNYCWFIYGKVKTINEPTGINYITGEAIKLKDFYSRYPICHQATFTRKKAFELIGLFNHQYKLAADTEWFARLFKANPEKAFFANEIIAYYDIQGATYVKRMAGYREYLKFGLVIFPWYVSVKNILAYPLLWLKVKLIRLLTNTTTFKNYRKLKYKNKRS